MAHFRKEGTVMYSASGKVLILGVCGMEKKVYTCIVKSMLTGIDRRENQIRSRCM